MNNGKADTDRAKGGRRSPNSGGRRSPNKGNRSPNSYMERTTTVTFVEPRTGDRYCTKLNRVEQSRASRENGGTLCDDFLYSHCDLGRQCPKVHVPKSYLWKLIVPRVDAESLTYYAGFEVQCYLPDLTRYYTIPSEKLFLTEGTKHYIELYNNDGDNFKEKCFLCKTMSETGTCDLGDTCHGIHCVTPDYDQFKSIATHVATAAAVTNYQRMPDGFSIPVFQSNSGDAAILYPGSDVLRTVGATRYEEELKNGTQPSGRMQHCAHFQNKKMCRLGDGCRFIHVVSLALSTPMADETSNKTSPQRSPVTPTIEDTTAEQRNKAAAQIADLIDGGGVGGPMGTPIAYSYPAAHKNNVSPPANGHLMMSKAANAQTSRSPNRSPVMVPIIRDNASPLAAAPALTLGGSGPSAQQRSPTRRNDPYNTGS